MPRDRAHARSIEWEGRSVKVAHGHKSHRYPQVVHTRRRRRPWWSRLGLLYLNTAALISAAVWLCKACDPLP